jgi:putative ABC transport system permease protein
LIGIIVGTAVTLVATYVPARRAAKVPPIAAMRDVAIDRSGASVKRAVAGFTITAGGAALIAMGLTGGGVPPVALGAFACFAGVAILGPVVAPQVARIIGAPIVRMAGVTGSIAKENARRNPKRSSATASSLMIGLGLVVFITVLASSTKTSFRAMVNGALEGDWIVSTTIGQGGVSPDVAKAIEALPETGAVGSIRYTATDVSGQAADVSAFDPAVVDQLLRTDVTSGTFSNLGDTGIAIQADVAESHGWSVGDHINVTFPETGQRDLTVAAVYEQREPLGDYMVSMATYEANVADLSDRYIFVANASGVSTDEAAQAIRGVLESFPTAKLQTGSEFAASMASQIDKMLNLIYALLALAVVIALFGIANTLALSVHERTRELGLLRAVGMARRQVRAAVRYESVIIALLGTGMGMLVGIGFGTALVQALSTEGVDHLVVPVVPMIGVITFGIIAGIVSSALPARRAARLDVLTALHAE